MRLVSRFPLLAVLLLTLSPACSQPGTDSHREVFQTPEQAAIERRGQQQAEFQDLAVTILAVDRPAVKAEKEGQNSIHVEADGVSRSVSLVESYESLGSHPNQERTVLHAYLSEQLRPFDADRLRALGFDAVKPHLFPMLVNSKQLDEMRAIAVDPKEPPPATLLFTDLYRITVVRWDKFGVIPLSPGLLGPKVTQSDLDAAAMEGLAKSFHDLSQPRIELIDFGPLGRSAKLAAHADAAAILLPEFAAAARAALQTDGDIVLLAPTASEVDIIRRKDEKLLDRLIPLAKGVYARADEPLCNHPILLSNGGLALLSYTPATQPATRPATAPATTKHAYIVR